MSDTTEGIERALAAWEGAELRETVLAAVREAIQEERAGAPWRPLTEVCADTAMEWFMARLVDPAAVKAVGEALEDAALTHLGRDLGTAHRDDIATAALQALAAMFAPAAEGDAGVGS